MSKAKFEDLTGQTFNYLTAVRMARHQPGKGFIWLWKCGCGNEIEKRQIYVVSGHAKSCGCREHNSGIEFRACVMCGLSVDRRTPKGKLAARCKKCYNKKCNHSDTPVVYLLARARSRAREAGLPCTITREDIVIPEYCPVLGIRMSFSGMENRSSSPSLDKIIPELGYVPGNSAIISHRANNLKNNGTVNEHRRIADWMESQLTAGIEATA